MEKIRGGIAMGNRNGKTIVQIVAQNWEGCDDGQRCENISIGRSEKNCEALDE